jgi:hypothetical protein
MADEGLKGGMMDSWVWNEANYEGVAVGKIGALSG